MGQNERPLVGAGKVIAYSQYTPFADNGRYHYLRLAVDF